MEIHLFKATQRRPMCQQELGLRPNFIRDLRPAKAEEVNVAPGFSPAAFFSLFRIPRDAFGLNEVRVPEHYGFSE
jgi:hypothetical protein